MPFTSNFCRNPSLQMGLTGFSALQSASISLDKTNVLYGIQSCLVSCPGHRPGEGCILPGGVIPGNSLCSASVFVTGTGDITISCAINPGGTVVASKQVHLTGQWERIQFTGITCTPGQVLYLITQTTIGEACQFWISGIQIEDSSPSHPYCDGDQDGCEWLEGFWGGISICHYENSVVVSSNAVGTSNIVNVLNVGQKFFITSESSFRSRSDLVFVSGPGPVAAVKDFAVAQLTDPDPAQTYTSWNTAGTISATGNTYTRNWGIFYPPVDYLVSGGSLLYKRAAYMAAGWYFASVPGNGTVNITRIQTEVLPVTTGYSAPSPTAFDPPRAVHSIIKPDRLNYCTNPSIEVSTTGWSAVGSASISQDATTHVGQIIEYDDNILTAGTKSLKAVVNANGDGAQIDIPDLITGYTYIASAYVQAGQGMDNIVMSIANGSTSVLATGGTGYSFDGYGQGPYGGINPSSDLATSTWFRIFCIFTATSDTHTLQVTSAASTDIIYPSSIWVDAIMVEQGELLSFYFDGSFGNNYSWESSAGTSRSYYYDQMQIKQQAVLNILQGHVPLGIDFDTPKYSVPPIQ